MKTRETLSQEQWDSFVADKACCTEHMAKRAFENGFDAGFARAVEMLHSAHDPNEHVGTQWADWLLKQQSKCGLCYPGKPCNFENCPDDLAEQSKEPWE